MSDAQSREELKQRQQVEFLEQRLSGKSPDEQKSTLESYFAAFGYFRILGETPVTNPLSIAYSTGLSLGGPYRVTSLADYLTAKMQELGMEEALKAFNNGYEIAKSSRQTHERVAAIWDGAVAEREGCGGEEPEG